MEHLGGEVEAEQKKFLDDYVESGKAENRSKAMRDAIVALQHKEGYRNGVPKDTPLRQTIREFARFLIYAGFAWFAFTVLWSVEIRLAGVLLLAVGVILLGVDRFLAQVEPNVTNRLHAVVGRDKA